MHQKIEKTRELMNQNFYHNLGRPLSPLYSFAMRLREQFYVNGVLASTALDVPVISIGNLTLGGTGKTPLVQHLARLLQRSGFRPAIITTVFYISPCSGKSFSAVLADTFPLSVFRCFLTVKFSTALRTAKQSI